MEVEEKRDGRQIVGRRLREVREAQGRSLDEVEQAIKIHLGAQQSSIGYTARYRKGGA